MEGGRKRERERAGAWERERERGFVTVLYIHSTGVEAIVENLSQQLESSTSTEPSTKPEDPTVVKLAALRKQLLVQMTSQLHKAEEAGGMKNICFFQVCMDPKLVLTYLGSKFWKILYCPYFLHV